MSSLIVTCPEGIEHDSPRVVNGIVNIVSEYLKERRADGEWELELFRKTGGGGQERIQVKRRTNLPGGAALICQVRPLDRDSSWNVLVHPPSDVDLEKLLSYKEQPKEPQEEKQDKEEKTSSVLFLGQVCFSKVKSHHKHGLNVEIEEKGKTIGGFIPLADLGGYNPNVLKKYPVGKSIKVLVCDLSRSPITCSTRVDTVLSSDDSHDVFTGTSNQDGLLSLKSYAKNFKRIYELVEALIPVMVASKENFISFDRAIEEATKYLLWKYKSTSIDSRAVPAILRQLCGFMEAMQVPLLARHSSGKGYELTNFAWSELGGKDYWFDRVAEVASQNDYKDATMVVEAEVPKSESGSEDHVKEQEASATVGAVPHVALIQEVEEYPVQSASSTEIKNCAEDVSICLDSAAKYLGKSCRLAEISSHLSSLQAEKEEIECWLERHKELKGLMKELQSFSAISKSRVDDLTKS
jgi:hypothetical protein